MNTDTHTPEQQLGAAAAAPDRDVELPADAQLGASFTLSDRALDRLLVDILRS